MYLFKDQDTKSGFAFTVPQCLQRLFGGDKILPYNLPSWLEPFAKVKKVPFTENDVDVDIDIYGVFDELHKQALKLIGREQQPDNLER